MTALATATLPAKDLLSLDDLQAEHLELIFDVAAKLKAGRDEYTDLLKGKRLAMIFEKDSLRTRFTFDIGMTDMGGTTVFLDHRDARLGSRESVKDMARNLERWVDVIVARTYKQRAIEELAANCEIPVINGLSDHSHPCQALTDYFTLTEKFGDLKGKTLCYVGDGNNTCHSLMVAGTKLGVHVVVCTPEGYEPDSAVTEQCVAWSKQSGGSIKITSSVDDGVQGAHVIYTDVWASMGQEDEIEERAAVFNDYQVDEEMMELADPNAYFLHCLPAHRGAEVSAGVMDGPQSIVYDNAENRLHVQKAIMVLLLNAWN